MSVVADVPTKRLSENHFKEIAYRVTGEAFALHNAYGQYFSEKVFKYELAAACRRLGYVDVVVESPVHVTFGTFTKTYFIDLLVERGALFELKAEQALHPAHEAQTLNYLFLSDLNRAKLLNFGAPSLEHRFVSTKLTTALRRRIDVVSSRWTTTDEESDRFKSIVIDLLNDWGAFLHLALYYDAITHFFGGEDVALRWVSVVRDGQIVTKQKAHVLNARTAFKLTAIRDHTSAVEAHLRRFLRHTELDVIQWVNLGGHQIEFVTLIDEMAGR